MAYGRSRKEKKRKDQSDSQNSVAEGEHAVVGEKTMENSH